MTPDAWLVLWLILALTACVIGTLIIPPRD